MTQPFIAWISLDDRDLKRAAPDVIAWVALNHEALATFWWDGAFWSFPEVEAFIASLKTI
ncbi:MAG: hypothetical protein ACK4VY_12270 [Brevundimonas sp.]